MLFHFFMQLAVAFFWLREGHFLGPVFLHLTSRIQKILLSLRLDMSTYCCTQFVVSRKRLERVPDAFWSIRTAR